VRNKPTKEQQMLLDHSPKKRPISNYTRSVGYEKSRLVKKSLSMMEDVESGRQKAIKADRARLKRKEKVDDVHIMK
jgi:hypothetical protein